MRPELRLEPVPFEALRGWRDDPVEDAWASFLASAAAILQDAPPLRPASPPEPALRAVARLAVEQGAPDGSRAFFQSRFTPHLVASDGFVTAYYEPRLDGALRRSADFTAPILARPRDLGLRTDPYPDRRAVRAGAIADQTVPVVWLRDSVEVFLVQVQGSARVRLPDGRVLRLIYDGRNGHPYTSIGRILIETGAVAPDAMSLAVLKGWLRDNGADAGGVADEIMNRNRSYVFFRAVEDADGEGPLGGQGVPLRELRSLAVDRTVWPYGLPFWVEAALPGPGGTPAPFPRLMVAQDTGSAILGPARADLFFGSGPAAGDWAGSIRHPANLAVLLPRGGFA